MPHPEAYLSFYNNPSWAKLKREGKEIERENTGQVIFDNIVNELKDKSAK